MNKEKISERDLKALIILGMFLVFVVSYFVGFRMFLSGLSDVKMENASLESQLLDLRNKEARKQEYEDQIEENKAKIDAIIQQFPSKVTEAKTIYDLDVFQKELGPLRYDSITFDMNGVFYSSTGAGAEGTDAATDGTQDSTSTETAASEVKGYKDGVTLVYRSQLKINIKDLSYQNLKKLIHNVQNYDGRLTIEAMNLAYSDASGLLGGTIVLNWYSLEGSDNEYKVPEITGIASGRKNIFGSFDK